MWKSYFHSILMIFFIIGTCETLLTDIERRKDDKFKEKNLVKQTNMQGRYQAERNGDKIIFAKAQRDILSDQPALDTKIVIECKTKYTNCNNCTTDLRCKAGVGVIEDGCGCCTMCSRQQGDLCNKIDRCDEAKNLYCDFKLDAGFRGICRSKNARSCLVDGKSYMDGQVFNPNCSLICTCQDGRYACSSKCPQELRQPSGVHCKESYLVSIKDRCCKEWVCPHSHTMSHSDDTPPAQYPNETPCTKESTAWSSCSVTCGMGESMRITNDNDRCQPTQERRLCIIRPCDYQKHVSYEGKNCTTKVTDKSPRKLQYAECESEELHTLTYCSTCKRNKCCGPTNSTTREIHFKCPEEKRVSRPFMFITHCKCFRQKDCPFH